MATVTGVPGTQINATTTVSNSGQNIGQGESTSTAQALADDLATLKSGSYTRTSAETVGAGGKLIFTPGASPPPELRGTVTADTTGPTTKFDGFTWEWTATSNLRLLGRVVPRSARVAVPDAGTATKVLGVGAGTGIDYAGKRFALPGLPPSVAVRTLKSTGVVPQEGETIEIIVGGGGVSLTTGNVYAVKREGATNSIATFKVTANGTQKQVFWAEFEFVSGVWRLGANSGCSFDGTTDVGVVPGDDA